MKSMSSLRAFLLLLVSTSPASGFVGVQQPKTTRVSNNIPRATALNVASPNMDSDFSLQQMRNLELPKNARPLRESAQDTLLETVEVSIGRVAMVAALVFCAVEVTTGESILEQLATLSSFS